MKPVPVVGVIGKTPPDAAIHAAREDNQRAGGPPENPSLKSLRPTPTNQ